MEHLRVHGELIEQSLVYKLTQVEKVRCEITSYVESELEQRESQQLTILRSSLDKYVPKFYIGRDNERDELFNYLKYNVPELLQI